MWLDNIDVINQMVSILHTYTYDSCKEEALTKMEKYMNAYDTDDMI